MVDPALGHPASRVRPWRPSAPAPLLAMIAVDVCLFAFAALMALTDAPWWSFLVPLVIGAAVLVVYGWRAAAVLGIRSRDETPRGWLMALAVPGGAVGVLAAHAGRYAGLVIVAYLVLAQGAERVVWARFHASRRVGERCG